VGKYLSVLANGSGSCTQVSRRRESHFLVLLMLPGLPIKPRWTSADLATTTESTTR